MSFIIGVCWGSEGVGGGGLDIVEHLRQAAEAKAILLIF